MIGAAKRSAPLPSISFGLMMEAAFVFLAVLCGARVSHRLSGGPFFWPDAFPIPWFLVRRTLRAPRGPW